MKGGKVEMEMRDITLDTGMGNDLCLWLLVNFRVMNFVQYKCQGVKEGEH